MMDGLGTILGIYAFLIFVIGGGAALLLRWLLT